jgi:TolB-like protein/tetratricopeptide (TPR) repeat protein
MSIFRELRQRQVFQLVGLYVVGAWVVIEVASVFFPAWDIPDMALRYLFIAAAVLLPVVFLFGWLFDVRQDGLFRTTRDSAGEIAEQPLERQDFVALSALTGITVAVLAATFVMVWNTAEEDTTANTPAPVERMANSIAVLPFTNLDTNPDTGYFSDGVTEEVLHRLSTTRALHVLGRTSSFAYRDSEKGPAAISEALGVEYLLHGSVRRDLDFVRVTAQLLDQTGLLVWSKTFDRRLENIFGIQSEIAGAVVEQITSEIITSNTSGADPTTDVIAAYDEYLVGRHYTHSRTDDWREKSQAAFRKAIELDPEYAPAWAGLAYSLVIMPWGACDEACFIEATEAAHKSVALDPYLADGHAILGNLQWEMQGLTEEGERNLRRAIELDPAFPEAYNWLSLILRNIGKYQEADQLLMLGNEIDPLFPPIAANLMGVLSMQGEYEEAVRVASRIVRLGNPPMAVHGSLRQTHIAWGRFVDAVKLDLGPTFEIFHSLGMSEQADQEYASFSLPVHWRTVLAKMSFLRQRGEHEEALRLLEGLLVDGGYVIAELPNDSLSIYLRAQLLAGEVESAISQFETWRDGDPAKLVEFVDALPAMDTLNALGLAYLESGQKEKARAVLTYRPPQFTRLQPYRAPFVAERLAINAALLGDTDEAHQLLAGAIDRGWAHYYTALNNPLWRNTLQEPRFIALLERVQENIAQQRAEVEALLQSSD